MSYHYRLRHRSSSSHTPGETAAGLHENREDEEEEDSGEAGPSAAGGTAVYSLPPLMSYVEDGSSAPDACVAAASLSPFQVRSMASAIAKGRNEGTSIVRSKRRMKENTDNPACSIDSQLERNSLLNRSIGGRDLLLEASARDCYENIAAKCRVEDGDCQRPLVRNVYKDGSYIDGGCFEGYNVSYGKNSRGEQNAGFCQVVNQLSIGLDKTKNKKNKTDKMCAVPTTKYEQSNLRGNKLYPPPAALRGVANPTDPDKLLCISKQDLMNPNGVLLHSGMKLEEFIKMLVNSLRAGDESQVAFVGREIYLLKSLKPPIGQSEVEMYNLALNKIKNAILYYVTNYVEEKYAFRVFYALYLISQFFVNVTRDPSDGGTEDAECIIKALLLIRKCPTKNIAVEVEQAFGTNNDKRTRGQVSESELLSALEKCDVKLIRFLLAKLCCSRHDGGDFAAIDVVSESFPEPDCSMKNTDVYDSAVVRENFDFANKLWKQLLNLAMETDRKIKDSAANPFVGLSVNVVGVAMDALRVFYNGTFYTSNTTSKLSILSSACVLLAYARSQLAAASPLVLVEADIRDTVDAVSDDTFDYERDHCYMPTSERYETTGLVAFDEVYAPRSSAVTYVPHQEFPSLVQKVSGTCPRQIEYYKHLREFSDDDMKKPCTPATALYATALKLAGANYSERIKNLAAATINSTMDDQNLGCTMDNLAEEDTGHPNVNMSEERYLLSTDEDMIKRFRISTVSDKYGLDKTFMYAIKRLLGVSTPAGRYGLNLIDADILWPMQQNNSYVKQDEMNGPNKRHRIAFESGVIGPYSTLDSEDPMVVADTTAEANWDDFEEYLSAKAENKMRFLSLIILRAIMGVGKKLTRSDIHLSLGEDKRIFYVTIENEERVGLKKCEDVLEDAAEFIALCTPVTEEDMQFLPPWCAGLFDDECDIMKVKKKPRKKSKRAAAAAASLLVTASNSEENDDEFVETTDRFKKAFKYSDLTRFLHEMSLEQLEEGNADGSLMRKMINRNMKAARNTEHDKTLADANSRLRAAYGAVIQDKYLYEESSRGDIYSQEYDSDEDMYNPFIPEGEHVFFHVATPQDTEYAQSDDGDNILPTLTPAEKLRQEYFRYRTYNSNCKRDRKVSLPSSDDECQHGDYILITRKMILNDIKMSISEAARASSFVFFDRCMRRIYRNLNRISQAAEFLHEQI